MSVERIAVAGRGWLRLRLVSASHSCENSPNSISPLWSASYLASSSFASSESVLSPSDESALRSSLWSSLPEWLRS